MASFEECVSAVQAAGKIGKQRALELLSQVDERAQAMVQSGVADAHLQAASQLAKEAIEETQRAHADALRNVAARAEITERMLNEAKGRVAPGVSAAFNPLQTKLTLADGLRSILHEVEGAERHDTVEGLWGGLARHLVSPMATRLQQLGLLKLALADGEREGFAEAIWRLNGNTPNPEVTVSRNAQQMAEAAIAPLRLLKERLNALGANIGDAVDYVTHTTWNSRQLRRAAGGGPDYEAAFQAWKARDVPLMAEKTFDGILPRAGETVEQARERFIRSLYEATESGVHMGSPNMAGFEAVGDYIPPAYERPYIPPTYEGTHNIARAVSHERVVYWKNAQAWAQHMKEFGGGNSLYHDIVRTLDVGARRIALMHYLGTNPSANFETIVKRVLEQHRTSDELGRLQGQLNGVRNVLGRLTGEFNRPIKEDAGNLTNQLMALEATAHLGGVSITHLMAAPSTFTSEMVHHGVGRLQTIANMLTIGRGSAERRAALADAGAYAHGWTLALHRSGSMGEVWQRDGLPGFVSWASAHFMRTTGLPQILDSLQANGVKSVLMARLGQHLEDTFEHIERHQQAALKAYRIGPEEWGLLKTATEPSMVEGNRWLTPNDALNTSRATVEGLLRRDGTIAPGASGAAVESAVSKFQWELGDKLLMYLNDAADRGAVRPGVRERAVVMGNVRPGESSYLVRRALSQFKMWPFAATAQILARDIARSLNNKEMAANLGIMIALTTIGGAMRMSINDLATGRPQRDYTNPFTYLLAAAQGGGLGIYGDFLLGETSRMSTGVLSTLAGPLAGDGERLWNLFTRFRTDLRTEPGKAMQHLWPDLAHLLATHVPFANLIYLKGTLDYLVWYHLFEAASPGWWERTNRRLQKEQGRTMIGYHPGAPIPWTPYGIGGR